MTTKRAKSPEPRNTFGDVLDEMTVAWSKWADELWERRLGFKQSAYRGTAISIARLVCIEPTSEGVQRELVTLKEKFRKMQFVVNAANKL